MTPKPPIGRERKRVVDSQKITPGIWKDEEDELGNQNGIYLGENSLFFFISGTIKIC
jgi:hypothetical protein